jgi:hypothetical protein
MRTTVKLAVLAGVSSVLLFAGGTARAQSADGVYEVKYEEIPTNCPTKLTYAPGNLTLKVRGSQLVVDIDRTPQMVGATPKNGTISAKSKPGNTMIEGMKGVFSVAGRVTPEGLLYLVMVGEYSANGKPLCTQSWNVSGPKAVAPAKDAKPGTTPKEPKKP